MLKLTSAVFVALSGLWGVSGSVLAAPITDPADIRQRLVEQVTGVVRWTESITWLTGPGGVTHLAELGTGKVLTGLAKRINGEAIATAVSTPADIDAFVAELSA